MIKALLAALDRYSLPFLKVMSMYGHFKFSGLFKGPITVFSGV